MLTEQERKWLEFRKDVCFRCKKRRQTCSPVLREICQKAGYPIRDLAMVIPPDYRDAAEFEARVAEKLAEHAGSYNRRNGIGSLLRPNGCSWYKDTGGRDTVCPPKHDIDDCPGIPFCNLYLARIAVEEEMDECLNPRS